MKKMPKNSDSKNNPAQLAWALFPPDPRDMLIVSRRGITVGSIRWQICNDDSFQNFAAFSSGFAYYKDLMQLSSVFPIAFIEDISIKQSQRKRGYASNALRIALREAIKLGAKIAFLRVGFDFRTRPSMESRLVSAGGVLLTAERVAGECEFIFVASDGPRKKVSRKCSIEETANMRGSISRRCERNSWIAHGDPNNEFYRASTSFKY